MKSATARRGYPAPAPETGPKTERREPRQQADSVAPPAETCPAPVAKARLRVLGLPWPSRPPWDADTRRIVIVGTGGTARALGAALCHQSSSPSLRFEGYVDDQPAHGVETIGRIQDLEHLARTRFLDEVIVCLPNDAVKARHTVFLARKLDLDVKVVPETYGCQLQASGIGMVGNVPLLTLREKPARVLRPLLKRVFDVVGSAALLLLLLPVLALIAVLVRLDSPGPSLYRAPRMGRKGYPFSCYKFRSMRTEADREKQTLRKQNERAGPFFKIQDDPRVTRVGRFLRRYSLDELPQFWNVLRGEMSMVGPRPHPLDDHAHYLPEHLQRLTVTPGLTGLWQVTARRDPSFERNMELDREYIENQSLAMDLWILFRTVREVAIGSGV